MKLIDQVITLSQAKRLKELGVKQQSVACFIGDELHLFEKSFYNWAEQKGMNAVAAFTVAELGVMLPASIKFGKKLACLRMVKSDSCEEYNQPDCYLVGYYTSEKEQLKDWVMGNGCEGLADAAAGMLIMLIDSGKVAVEEVNARLCAE